MIKALVCNLSASEMKISQAFQSRDFFQARVRDRHTEAAPKIRARPGLMMAGLGDRQDEREEQEARFDVETTIYR